MKISVYGSALGGITDDAKEKAQEVGRLLVGRGHALITGACPGLPYEAVQAASSQKPRYGKIIGYSPGVDIKDHVDRFGFPVEGFDDILFIPMDYQFKHIKGSCLKLRNVSSVSACDAAVIISGRTGTMNEFSIAYDLGKTIGVLIGTGGFADEIGGLVERLGKKTEARLIFSPSPHDLLNMIEKEQSR